MNRGRGEGFYLEKYHLNLSVRSFYSIISLRTYLKVNRVDITTVNYFVYIMILYTLWYFLDALYIGFCSSFFTSIIFQRFSI